MRRLALTVLALLALASPGAALALHRGPGDGTLVVRNADNGQGVDGRPVVVLVVHGSVIGRITDQGRIRIDDLTQADPNSPEVTGATWHQEVTDTATAWGGIDLHFRAIGGAYKLTIWGSKVDLFALGTGKVTLVGQAYTPAGDGIFSLEGGDFRSLPVGPLTATFGAQQQTP